MAALFRGGIYPDYNKEKTFASPVVEPPAPQKVVIPLSQHTGEECKPLVQVGEHVLMGQRIGEADAEISCPVHASVSGTVTDISEQWHPCGLRRLAVTIKNDFADMPDASCEPYEGDPLQMTPEQIIQYAYDAGIAGMGGGGFPLCAKLRAGLDKGIDILIVNGMESEPFVTCDHRAMVEYPNTILDGVRLVMRCVEPRQVFVAVGDDMPDAINTMQTLCASDRNIQVIPLRAKYPQGGEKQLIQAVTGREVAPGTVPLDIGCIVLNVDTCASLARAVYKGRPLTKRIVTVSGSAVITPKNLLVRIGTLYKDVFDHCGGFYAVPYKIVAGGPLLGQAQHHLETPVIKDTSALLAFCGDEDTFEDKPTCIRCGTCVRVCPMKLMPNYIYFASNAGEYDRCARLNVEDCIECGSCSYGCPGKLYLMQSIRKAKKIVKDRRILS